MLSHTNFVRSAIRTPQWKNVSPLFSNARKMSIRPTFRVATDKPAIETPSPNIAEKKEEIKKPNFIARQKSKLAQTFLNNQGNLKFYTVYGGIGALYTYFVTAVNEGVHLLQDIGYSGDVVANATYGAGILHALLFIAAIKTASNITSLAGRPSEGVVHEIMEHARTHPGLMEKLGGKPIAGQFSTVSTIDGGFRWNDTRGQIYEEWLASIFKGQTYPSSALPLPKLFAPVIYWLNGNSISDAMKKARKISKDVSTIEEKARNYEEKKNEILRVQKTRNDYSGWERYWAPRRLQMVMHVYSPDRSQNGIVIAEVEKAQTGLGSAGSGGFIRFKTLQYVDLSNGEVTSIEGSERPVLMGNVHLTKLFETIPAPLPTQAENFLEGIKVTDLEEPVVPRASSVPLKSTM